MIDSLISCDRKNSISGLLITEKNIFTENGVFTEPGLIENIAQTVAAGASYYFRNVKNGGNEVPIGYIGAIKDLEINFLPKVNSHISTEIELMHEILDITIVSGKVLNDGKIAAECTMKIFIDKDNEILKL
ncbi:MAG: 3-hydroxyacyl-ACP dehydratase [Bacteroidetes bacterium]|nr:MAG: 3-hydroxyacyl-ACP dehydratase [Bacteroidota bacterium]